MAILLVVVTAGAAAAAIVVTYTNTSTVTTSVTPPPIQFLLGDDTAALSDYVTAISVSTNMTYLTTSVKGVPEATVAIGSFFKLRNVDDASHAITLSTANVTNSLVSAYTLAIYDDTDALVSTMDLRAASASVTASATIPASTTYSARLSLTLASGAGADNVALSNSLTLTFT